MDERARMGAREAFRAQFPAAGLRRGVGRLGMIAVSFTKACGNAPATPQKEKERFHLRETALRSWAA
jgi:hypothetical protein